MGPDALTPLALAAGEGHVGAALWLLRRGAAHDAHGRLVPLPAATFGPEEAAPRARFFAELAAAVAADLSRHAAFAALLVDLAAAGRRLATWAGGAAGGSAAGGVAGIETGHGAGDDDGAGRGVLSPTSLKRPRGAVRRLVGLGAGVLGLVADFLRVDTGRTLRHLREAAPELARLQQRALANAQAHVDGEGGAGGTAGTGVL